MHYGMIKHLSPDALVSILDKVKHIIGQHEDSSITPREAIEAIHDAMEMEVILFELNEAAGEATPKEVLEDLKELLDGGSATKETNEWELAETPRWMRED